MANETILIVDDSAELARVLKTYMLSPLGYEVLYAPDGQEGLALTIEHNPDLILLDMNMPHMSGMEMLVALRDAKCTAPVIFITMHGSERVAVQAFRLGVCNYLIKPFTSEEVREAVDGALQEIRLAREKEALTHNLIATETVRQTTVTLAHYINNYLMTLKGGLTLLEDKMAEQLSDPDLLEIIDNSHRSAVKIEAVLRVLQRVSKVEERSYHGQVKMLDVEAALEEELEKMNSGS